MKQAMRVVVAGAGLWACVALAQSVTPVRPMLMPKPQDTLQVDYKAQYERERATNQRLRDENTNLHTQIDAWTRKGGSLVHAWCETPTLSVNSAGASSDCADAGYTCEPVSGLCRTSAANSDQCAVGYTWCTYGNRCVRSINDCRG
jgi:hypothetical protein